MEMSVNECSLVIIQDWVLLSKIQLEYQWRMVTESGVLSKQTFLDLPGFETATPPRLNEHFTIVLHFEFTWHVLWIYNIQVLIPLTVRAYCCKDK